MSGGKGVAAITLLLKRILLTKLIFIFPGENQCLVPKMDCHHHHTGNRTLIVHLPFRLVSRCFLVAPRSQSVRGWLVCSAEFLSYRGIKGKFQLLPSLFPVWQSADPLLQQMFTPSPLSSVCSVLSPVEVVTVELLVWPTGSWHVQVQDTKNLDLKNSTPPNGLSSLSHLLLHLQSFLGNLTPRGFSRPLSISTDAAVLHALLPFGPLRIFGKLATSRLI